MPHRNSDRHMSPWDPCDLRGWANRLFRPNVSPPAATLVTPDQGAIVPVNLSDISSRAKIADSYATRVAKNKNDTALAEKHRRAVDRSQADVNDLLAELNRVNTALNAVTSLRNKWADKGSPTGDPDNALWDLDDALNSAAPKVAP